MNLFQYLLHRATWQKLPPLPRMYSVEYDEKSVDEDTATLMSQTHIRCPQGVEILKRKHGMASSRELIVSLPPRRRQRHIWARLLALVRRAFGLLPYDPMKSIAREHMRRRR